VEGKVGGGKTVDSKFADALHDKRIFVGSVVLASDLLNYSELREDQHLMIHVPNVAISPGSLFYVPVKLQAESNLQVFVIRVKCRNGVRVRSAEVSDTSLWRITTDVTQQGRGAIVTASIRNDSATYDRKFSDQQELFGWLFEVDNDVPDDERGRMVFTHEYEMTSSHKETFSPVRNKAIATVRFMHDNQYSVVPLVKMTELVNTAVLTGQTQSWPMRVFLLNHFGQQATDVTMRSTCYSQNERVLQASVTCDFVYFDGTESQGSSSIGIIVKFGQTSRIITFRVWIPELPLDVDLSDDTLSLIAGWKIPAFSPANTRMARNSRQALDGSTVLTTDVSVLAKDNKALPCPSLRFQSAVTEVYARFVLSSSGDGTSSPVSYLIHRKALFRVTHLVRHQLRIADTTVARLRDGNIVDGVKPGRTEVQVMLNTGRVIGASVVKVTGDRVNVQRLDVDVVSGLSMSIGSKVDFPGTLAVRVIKTRSLHYRYQEAVLDLTLRTDDGAALPLYAVPDGHYTLTAETLDNNIVTLAPPHRAQTVTIMAVAPGTGDLVRVSFGVSDVCPSSKPLRPIAIGFGFVNVEFDELTQNDDSFYHHGVNFDRFDGRGGPVADSRQSRTSKGLLVDIDGADEQRRGGGGSRKRTGKNKLITSIDLKSGIVDKSSRPTGPMPTGPVEVGIPRNEAQKQQLVIESLHMTSSLEMAMYVLLAVFSVSVIIFAANCLVFVTRHRRKRKMPDVKEPISEVRDWVWIGRATLERNEVDIKCGRRLMSEADFTRNQCRRPASGTSLALPTVSGSNRISTVSTYLGSECSVRITANPLADAADDNGNILETAATAIVTAGAPKQHRESSSIHPEAYTVDRKQTQAAKMEMKSENADDEKPMSTSESESEEVHFKQSGAIAANSQPIGRPIGPSSSVWSTMSREDQLRELEEAVANGSGAEWDYEAFGMTYHELMDYFDNLKESTA
jgi:transmembrane protein 132